MATTAPPPARAEDKRWFALAGEAVAQELGVDERAGLSSAEAATRLERYGPNAFVAAETEPRWRAFVRQYRDPMQIVLLVAGIGSIWPLHELGTGLVLLFLTLFNAVLGLNQEGKAAAAVAALQKMMIVKAKVRRGGQLAEVPAEQLVPGDIVAIEAGDVVPADGRPDPPDHAAHTAPVADLHRRRARRGRADRDPEVHAAAQGDGDERAARRGLAARANGARRRGATGRAPSPR
jgi:P-type Ca2+ transporter type 2C